MLKVLIVLASVVLANAAYADIVCTTVGNVTTCHETSNHPLCSNGFAKC